MTALAEPLGIRHVQFGSQTLLSRIYVAVRDRDWRTLEPHDLNLKAEETADTFEVNWSAEYEDQDARVGLTATYRITPSEVAADMRAEIRSSFDLNRLGFCLLHPVELSGRAVRVMSPDGSHPGAFPTEVTTEAVFEEFTGLEYECGTTRISIDLFGDLFETEDQRNWSDASFKTFSTPLRLPRPRRVEPGEVIEQHVVLRVTSPPRDGVDCTTGCARAVARVPGSWTLPELGSVYFGSAEPSDPVAATRPAFWRVELDLRYKWLDQLRGACERSVADGVPLEIAFYVDPNDQDCLGAALVELEKRPAGSLRAVGAFELWRWASFPALNRRLTQWRARSGVDVAVLGGSAADFSELARNRDSLDGSDVVTFGINPQVHARDDMSVMETPAVHRHLAEQARIRGGSRPVEVGPVTLSARFNAAAQPHERPIFSTERDPRTETSFAAAWTVASLASLAGEPDAVVLHRTGVSGDIGLAVGPQTTPLEALMPLLYASSGQPCASIMAPAGITGLVIEPDSNHPTLLLANLTDARSVVRLGAGLVGLSAIGGSAGIEIPPYDVLILATNESD